MGDTILAIDVGTQSSRAVLYDGKGDVLAIGRRPHQPLISPEPGIAEFDAEDIWQAVMGSIEDALRGQPKPVALGLCAQRRCLVPVDRDARPLGNGYSWLDSRPAKGYPGMGALGSLTLLSGINRLPGALVMGSLPNLLHQQRPDDYARADRLLTLSGWLTRLLTGEDTDASGGMVGAWPFDVKTGDWIKMGWVHTISGAPLNRLPRLIPSGGILGRILPDVAERCGLSPHTPLVSVGGDKQAEVLGAGVTRASRGVAEVSLGTGASVSVVSDKGRMSSGFKWLAVSAAEPGAACHESIVPRGFWLWTWYLKQMGGDDVRAAQEQGLSPEAYLGRAIEAIRPGSDGLIALPRWAPVLNSPYDAGAIVGFSESHTRHHIARALVEGIVFDLRRGLSVLEGPFGAVRELRVGGGGSRSASVVQILADILDRPVQLALDSELAARGTAVVAAVAAGWFKDVEDALRVFARPAGTVTPHPQRAALYAKIYAERFLPALEKNRQLEWRRWPKGGSR